MEHMKPVILYVLGAPGVGKTTLVRGLFGDRPLIFSEPPEPKWTVAMNPDGPAAVAAGWYKGETFDGGDTVPYSGARAALEFWAASMGMMPPLTILDGQRFATAPSLAYLREVAPDHAIIGVHLVATSEELATRRAARGSNQSPSWMKGATTGARNFAAKIGAVDVPATSTEYVLAATLALIQKSREPVE
jgi:hypothetical protein